MRLYCNPKGHTNKIYKNKCLKIEAIHSINSATIKYKLDS